MNTWVAVVMPIVVAAGAVFVVKTYVDNLEKRYRRWMKRQMKEWERLGQVRQEQLLRERPWKWQEAWEWQLDEIRKLPEANKRGS